MFPEIASLSKLAPSQIIVSEDILDRKALGSDPVGMPASFLPGHVSFTDQFHASWLLLWWFQRLGTQRWPQLSCSSHSTG